MSTDIKLIKAQLSKIIQSGGFLGNMTGRLSQEALIKFAVSVAKDTLPQLTTRTTSSVIDNFEKNAWKSSRGEPWEQQKESIYEILMKICIRIVMSHENSGV